MKNNELFHKSVFIAQMLVSQKIHEGDVVVDATVGNGNDTLFLAQKVGLSGKVYGFDVQEQAIDNTRALLKSNGFEDNTQIILDGHQNIDIHIKEDVQVVMFNLGYLPKSDKQYCTKVDTTIEGIEKSLDLLCNGGLVTVVIYPGHDEGMKEKEMLLDYFSKLPQNEFNVFYIDLINQVNNPPVLLGIEKS